jgi:hypothetical protein
MSLNTYSVWSGGKIGRTYSVAAPVPPPTSSTRKGCVAGQPSVILATASRSKRFIAAVPGES